MGVAKAARHALERRSKKFEFDKSTMASFATALESDVDRPVADMTGLKGTYDIRVEFAETPRQDRAYVASRAMRTRQKIVFGLIGSLVAASPLLAHHEWPVDLRKRVKVRGTVTAFTWANPHVIIALDVEANGAIEKWKVGGSSPQYMTTCGWNKKSLKPGDVITVIGYRFKDGSNAARMFTTLMPNGKEMFYGAPPGRTAQCVPRGDDTPLAD